MSAPGVQAAVLGLDPARASGWALWLPSTIVASGVCATSQDRRACIVDAKVQAAARGLPLVVVYERHTVGGRRVTRRDGSQGSSWNPATMMGMGESRGRWLEQLELAEVPRSHVIGVTPGEWRRAALGSRTAIMARDELKALAIESCRLRGYDVRDDDQAEAILIALWGAQASAEVRILAQRKRRAA